MASAARRKIISGGGGGAPITKKRRRSGRRRALDLGHCHIMENLSSLLSGAMDHFRMSLFWDNLSVNYRSIVSNPLQWLYYGCIGIGYSQDECNTNGQIYVLSFQYMCRDYSCHKRYLLILYMNQLIDENRSYTYLLQLWAGVGATTYYWQLLDSRVHSFLVVAYSRVHQTRVGHTLEYATPG